MNLEMALKASEIKRWTIVSLTRSQSVGEHQYNTWLLAMAMYDAVFTTPHNKSDRDLLQELALTHDLSETITGDFPTTLKEIPGTRAMIQVVEESARQLLGLPSLVAHDGTIPMCILKIADTAEALIYLYMNGGLNRPQVWKSVRANYSRYSQKAKEAHPSGINWAAAHGVLLKALKSDPNWAATVGDDV